MSDQPLNQCQPVTARDIFREALLAKGYDPRLGFTKDALEAFDIALPQCGAAEPRSSVMAAAEKASEVVSGWSDAKRDYAARAITSTVGTGSKT